MYPLVGCHQPSLETAQHAHLCQQTSVPPRGRATSLGGCCGSTTLRQRRIYQVRTGQSKHGYSFGRTGRNRVYAILQSPCPLGFLHDHTCRAAKLMLALQRTGLLGRAKTDQAMKRAPHASNDRQWRRLESVTHPCPTPARGDCLLHKVTCVVSFRAVYPIQFWGNPSSTRVVLTLFPSRWPCRRPS